MRLIDWLTEVTRQKTSAVSAYFGLDVLHYTKTPYVNKVGNMIFIGVGL